MSLCSDCMDKEAREIAARIVEQQAARAGAAREGPDAEAHPTEPILTKGPKLDLLGWALAGGVMSGGVPGSGRGTIGVALLVLGPLGTFGQVGKSGDSSAQGRLIVLAVIFLLVAIALIASGYSAYTESYDKELRGLQESGKAADAH
jgi:hypothetical protein